MSSTRMRRMLGFSSAAAKAADVKKKRKRAHGVLDFFLTMLPLRLVSVPCSMMGEGVKFP
jgi:hypothetical protein